VGSTQDETEKLQIKKMMTCLNADLLIQSFFENTEENRENLSQNRILNGKPPEKRPSALPTSSLDGKIKWIFENREK
jgi:hypothetical protein